MKSKLYKLALWYIEKCNAEWNKRNFANELKSLDRLTYWNFGKYMLNYGADAEWQKFSRYEVLDNAIQKLADYENNEKEIRAKAIDEFAEAFDKWIKSDAKRTYYWTEFQVEFMKIAEQMKGGAIDG